VRTYGQYCPIARASELLAERWSFIILRNIVLIGCRTFNEIADGAPELSRGLLSKRLRDLERAGVLAASSPRSCMKRVARYSWPAAGRLGCRGVPAAATSSAG
jgi:DNA-binding HxlR family transcriptional regulator